MSLQDLRRDYALSTLDPHKMDPDPVVQFGRWFEAAIRSEIVEPNAMTLATATSDGAPSARIVLLKALDSRGLTFFTDYRSQKGVELEQNPRAAVVFHWKEIERQVRAAGRVDRTTPEESASYFRSRPRGSRLGAWASRQSTVLTDRHVLDEALRELERRFATEDPPCPPYWGGFRLVPQTFEFWQGRTDRLHDRVRYRRVVDGWERERLSP